MSWDKNKPAGTQKLRLSDDEIRDNWAALEDALGRDHEFPGTLGSTAGKHNGVRFRQQSSAPSTAATELALYVKEVSSIPQLFLRREDDGDEVQLTFGDKGIGIPSGTKMAFYQAAAPTGWSLVTGLTNGTLMYIDHANGGTQKSGGTWTISGLTSPSHNHSISTDGAHSHTVYADTGSPKYIEGDEPDRRGYTNSAGGHNHGGSVGSTAVTINADGNWRPPGYNFIIAEKD